MRNRPYPVLKCSRCMWRHEQHAWGWDQARDCVGPALPQSDADAGAHPRQGGMGSRLRGSEFTSSKSSLESNVREKLISCVLYVLLALRTGRKGRGRDRRAAVPPLLAPTRSLFRYVFDVVEQRSTMALFTARADGRSATPAPLDFCKARLWQVTDASIDLRDPNMN